MFEIVSVHFITFWHPPPPPPLKNYKIYLQKVDILTSNFTIKSDLSKDLKTV